MPTRHTCLSLCCFAIGLGASVAWSCAEDCNCPSAELTPAVLPIAYVIALSDPAPEVPPGISEGMVEVSATQVRVTVSDDGIGLEPARPPHVGLWSMHERAAEVGGRCAVTARAGGGTVVQATLPLLMNGQP